MRLGDVVEMFGRVVLGIRQPCEGCLERKEFLNRLSDRKSKVASLLFPVPGPEIPAIARSSAGVSAMPSMTVVQSLPEPPGKPEKPPKPPGKPKTSSQGKE